jgi:hypothetical protein
VAENRGSDSLSRDTDGRNEEQQNPQQHQQHDDNPDDSQQDGNTTTPARSAMNSLEQLDIHI